jgi:tRNA dimethylallyltransferase
MISRAIIIVGPTASGKTSLSEYLAQKINGEIINADAGQMYVPLTIGTAKPAWHNKPFKCHLFDVLNEPVEFNVAAYRTRVIEVVDDVCVRKKVPIIVGGSLFYVKSLLFPLREDVDFNGKNNDIDFSQDTETLWKLLQKIDPDRAAAIYSNDRYRIERALQIWQQTGQKPSTLQPLFNPVFHSLMISIELPRTIVYERINLRTEDMVRLGGWIEEAEKLVGTPWETFVTKRGFIGYKELFEWIKNGKRDEQLGDVIELIARKTRNYAKRQEIFLKMLKRQILESRDRSSMECEVEGVSSLDEKNIDSLLFSINKFISSEKK